MDYRTLIARRYLASRRQVSLISIITGISMVGVVLGVAALIVVLSVMNGFYDFVRDLMVSIDPHVRVVSAEEGGLAQADSLLEIARGIEHVESAAPYVEGKALFAHESGIDASQVVVVRGVEPDTAGGGPGRLVEEMGLGRFDLAAEDGMPGIVVGMGLARRFGLLPSSELSAPSTVRLLSAPAIERTFTQLFGAAPVRRFAVRGLYEVQGAAADAERVFIGLDEAQRLFGTGNRVSGIELRLDDVDRAEAVKAALEQRLPTERFAVQTWYDLQAAFYDAMRLEKWVAWAILLLIIVVAAFNIVGSLTMVVIKKRSDVGVLQAMGVSRRNIRRIFMTEGLLIGAIGTGAGVALGLALALLQQHFKLVPLAGAESFLITAYPVAIRPLDVALIALTSWGLCVLAAVYPARRAGAIEPARAVQIEG